MLGTHVAHEVSLVDYEGKVPVAEDRLLGIGTAFDSW